MANTGSPTLSFSSMRCSTHKLLWPGKICSVPHCSSPVPHSVFTLLAAVSSWQVFDGCRYGRHPELFRNISISQNFRVGQPVHEEQSKALSSDPHKQLVMVKTGKCFTVLFWCDLPVPWLLSNKLTYSAVPVTCDMSERIGFGVWLVFLIEKLNLQMTVANAGCVVFRWMTSWLLWVCKSNRSWIFVGVMFSPTLSKVYSFICAPTFSACTVTLQSAYCGFAGVNPAS